MSIAVRDLRIVQIENVIKHKKKMLIEKRRELEEKAKLNAFLHEVKSDYAKYYDFILKEKQQQYDALMLIKAYVGDLVKTDQLVGEQLRVAQYDQRDIIGEIDKVKAELDEIIKQN